MTENAKSDPAEISEENEIEVLSPDSEITLQGVTVLVHEFSFIEGLKAEVLARDMMIELAQILLDQGDDIQVDDLAVLFARHSNNYVELIAMSTSQPRQWVESLSDKDGQLLSWTFWAVNKGFFMRRLAMRRLSSRRSVPPS